MRTPQPQGSRGLTVPGVDVVETLAAEVNRPLIQQALGRNQCV
ncbi:MAG: hypothetical protein ACRD1C_00530 [Terriglobales bacterium]